MSIPVLKYKLSGHSAYVANRPVFITFTLENITNDEVWVLKWYTPLEGLYGKIFTVTCNGMEIPYEGPMMKRGDPEKEDYVHIGPGGAVSAEVDLSLAYTLPVTDKCRVDYRGRIYDIALNEEVIPRKRDAQQGRDIPGNSLFFAINLP